MCLTSKNGGVVGVVDEALDARRQLTLATLDQHAKHPGIQADLRDPFSKTSGVVFRITVGS